MKQITHRAKSMLMFGHRFSILLIFLALSSAFAQEVGRLKITIKRQECVWALTAKSQGTTQSRRYSAKNIFSPLTIQAKFEGTGSMGAFAQMLQETWDKFFDFESRIKAYDNLESAIFGTQSNPFFGVEAFTFQTVHTFMAQLDGRQPREVKNFTSPQAQVVLVPDLAQVWQNIVNDIPRNKLGFGFEENFFTAPYLLDLFAKLIDVYDAELIEAGIEISKDHRDIKILPKTKGNMNFAIDGRELTVSANPIEVEYEFKFMAIPGRVLRPFNPKPFSDVLERYE